MWFIVYFLSDIRARGVYHGHTNCVRVPYVCGILSSKLYFDRRFHILDTYKNTDPFFASFKEARPKIPTFIFLPNNCDPAHAQRLCNKLTRAICA